MTIRTDIDYARELDEQDELRGFRDRFVIDEPELLYLDGNSLGRLPKAAAARAEQLIRDEWGRRLIRGWNESWLELAGRIGAKIAPLIGACDDEVIVADSTSVNLFKLAAAALHARPKRTKVVTDELNFPSDLYVLQSAVRLLGGRRLQTVRSPDGLSVSIDDLARAIDADTALVSLSHVAFKSAFAYELAEVTALAHQRGATMLWDLSHSAGVMPIELNEAGVDLAVGCTYKYLHGGPGAPAFLYVRRDLQSELANPIGGWFGQRDPFAFELDYEPAPGLRRFLSGTPPVLSLAAIEPGVDLVLEAGLDRIRAKSVRQTDYLIELYDSLLAPLGLTLNSPRDAAHRGSHVSLAHPEGLRIAAALIDRFNVLPDFRSPDSIRLGVSPLCTGFVEVHAAVMALRTVLVQRMFEQYPFERSGVT